MKQALGLCGNNVLWVWAVTVTVTVTVTCLLFFCPVELLSLDSLSLLFYTARLLLFVVAVLPRSAPD